MNKLIKYKILKNMLPSTFYRKQYNYKNVMRHLQLILGVLRKSI